MSAILAPLMLLLPAIPGPQQAPGSKPDPITAAESRAAFRMRAADAAAATGIPMLIAEAPETGVVPPRRLYMPPLDELYPSDALRAEQQGLVGLRCTLTVKGTLKACALAQSSGMPSLDAAAFEVARFARYSPRIVDRVPQASEVVLPVRWVIAE